MKKLLLAFTIFIITSFGFCQVTNAEEINDNVCYPSEDIFTGNEDKNGINPEINNIVGYDQYIYSQGDRYFFNIDLAIENGENENIIQFGEIFNSLSKDYIKSPKRTVRSLMKAFSYGNWCGKGNNGKKPIDRLDRACKAHDLCYEKKGWGSKSCNRTFVNELKRIKGPNRDYQTLSVYGRLYLDAAIALFSKFM